MGKQQQQGRVMQERGVEHCRSRRAGQLMHSVITALLFGQKVECKAALVFVITASILD
jgi:hypothetical protein